MSSGWAWAAASVTGDSHLRRGESKQDSFSIRQLSPNGGVVVCVSDGAGSAKYGGLGSRLLTRFLTKMFETYFGAAAGVPMPDDDCIWNWIDEYRDLIYR
jgi:serine/threonine protein phosphatase PrpC